MPDIVLKNGSNKFITTLEPRAHLFKMFIFDSFPQYKSKSNKNPSEVQSPQNLRPNRMGFPRMNCFKEVLAYDLAIISSIDKAVPKYPKL